MNEVPYNFFVNSAFGACIGGFRRVLFSAVLYFNVLIYAGLKRKFSGKTPKRRKIY
jgi:hypothetical protein